MCLFIQREKQILLPTQVPPIIQICEHIAPPQPQLQQPLIDRPSEHSQIGHAILCIHVHTPNRCRRHPHQSLILGNSQLVEQSSHLVLTPHPKTHHQLHSHHRKQLQRKAFRELLDSFHAFFDFGGVRLVHSLHHFHPNLLDLFLRQFFSQFVMHPRRSPRENHRQQLRFFLDSPHLAALNDRFFILTNHRQPQLSEVFVEPFSEIHIHPMVQNHQLRLRRPRDPSHHQIPRVRIHMQFMKSKDHIAERLHANPTDFRLIEALSLQLRHIADFGSVDVFHHHDAARAETQKRLRNVHRRVFREERAAVLQVLRLAEKVELSLHRRADFRNDPL